LERKEELEKDTEEEEEDDEMNNPPPFPPVPLHPSIMESVISTLTNPLPIIIPHPSPDDIDMSLIVDPVMMMVPDDEERRDEVSVVAVVPVDGWISQFVIVKEPILVIDARECCVLERTKKSILLPPSHL
jgi:hypothetical protein